MLYFTKLDRASSQSSTGSKDSLVWCSPQTCAHLHLGARVCRVEVKPGASQCGQSSVLKKGLATHSPRAILHGPGRMSSGLQELRPGSRSRWGQSQI